MPIIVTTPSGGKPKSHHHLRHQTSSAIAVADAVVHLKLSRRHTCAEMTLCLCEKCACARACRLKLNNNNNKRSNRRPKSIWIGTNGICRGLNDLQPESGPIRVNQTGSLHGIDANYVAKCLRVKPSQVVTWSVRKALASGENFASSILRVRANLAGNEQDVQSSFIVKRLPDPSDGMRQIVQEVGMWQREQDAYTTVIPLIEKLVGHKLTPSLLPGPDPTDICLEDLQESGFKPADRRKMLDFEHSIIALETLAKFHAGSVAARNIHNKPELSKSVEEELFFKESRRKAAEDFMRAPFLYLSQDLVNSNYHLPELEKYSRPLRQFGDKIFDMLIQVSKPAGPFNVLNHGDFWTNNILFKYDKDDQVVDAKIIDFQNCRYTTPALDLQYFLMSSVNEEVRESQSCELVSAYLTALNTQLIALGMPTLDAQVLERDMATTECYGLYCATAVLATVINDPFDDIYCGANVPANVDSLNPFVKCMRGSSYRRMVPKLLAWFDRRGIFDTDYWPPTFYPANETILSI